MEMKSLQHPNEQHHQHQLPLISPEPPDHFRCITTSTNDASAATCDAIRVVQEEAAAARLAQNEGASSADSASSGYMSPHFLRPPSPSDDLMQPRRSSDSGVDLPGHEVSILLLTAVIDAILLAFYCFFCEQQQSMNFFLQTKKVKKHFIIIKSLFLF